MSGQEEVSPLQDQAAALVAEVRELREGYEQLVARIDDALAAGESGDATSAHPSYSEGGVSSASELYLLNIAMSGSTREDAAAAFTGQFGEAVDEELLDRVFDSVPPSQAPARRGRFHRRQ